MEINQHAFKEAVRQVLGIADPTPDDALNALQDENVRPKINAAYDAIVASPACKVADECAAAMKRNFDDDPDLTPADLGYDGIKTAAEMIASEWKSWFDEERT